MEKKIVRERGERVRAVPRASRPVGYHARSLMSHDVAVLQ